MKLEAMSEEDIRVWRDTLPEISLFDDENKYSSSFLAPVKVQMEDCLLLIAKKGMLVFIDNPDNEPDILWRDKVIPNLTERASLIEVFFNNDESANDRYQFLTTHCGFRELEAAS